MMSENTEKALYQQALSRFGLERQLRMVQEECAELIVAVSKVIREPGNVERIKDLIEETADVQIMCGQLAIIYGKDKIDAMMLKKHNRLRKRLVAMPDGENGGWVLADSAPDSKRNKEGKETAG